MAPIELVIFDNDGVLVVSEPIAAKTLALELSGCDIPIEAAEVAMRYSGWTLDRLMGDLETTRGKRLPTDFADRYHASLMAAFERDLEPDPAAVTVLDELDRQGIGTCVASNSSCARLMRTLAIVGLVDRFRGAAFGADDVAAGKPAPDLFLHAARVHGTAPGACVVVEDTGPGVLAAQRAGMRVIALRGTCPDDALGTPDRFVDRLGDVIAVIQAFDGVAGSRPPG